MNGGGLGRISVVGPCASGKSTLVRALRMHGYDAYVTAQEHSGVRNLWRRHEPDVLIALQVDLESVRLRRQDPRWRRDVWSAQQGRLSDAYAAADLVVDTTGRSAGDVVDEVLRYLDELFNQGHEGGHH